MGKWRRRMVGTAASLAALFVLYLIGSAVHLFPQLRNPFGETTTERSQPVVLTHRFSMTRASVKQR